MTEASQLIDQVAVFHEDAFTWALTCCGGDADAAADALQECYVKVAAGRAHFGAKSSLKTWWLAVVRITVFEQRRGQQHRRTILEAFRDWFAAPGGGTDDTFDLSAPPDADQLSAALERLPGRQREILHLVFQLELSVSEAAAVMRTSVGSARQHYERAKKRLRQELASDSPTPRRDHAS